MKIALRGKVATDSPIWPPQVPSTASRKPQGAGKHATAGKGGDGEDRPQRDGRAEKRVRSVQDETSTDKDGGRADQQGPRLRHRDRAVKRDE